MPQSSQYVSRVIMRYLPMWKLAFPGANLNVFQGFQRHYLFVIMTRLLANPGSHYLMSLFIFSQAFRASSSGTGFFVKTS
jgi:hypothetical protein